MPGRIALVLTSTLLALSLPMWSAMAAAGEAPTLGTPSITPTSAASVQVSVPVDSHGSETTVRVEYATAGAYRGAAGRVPSAATTVVIATTPASDAGPVTVTGQVIGLEPDASYLMRVRASNAGGETISTDVTVQTPPAPKTAFKATVGKDTTRLTKLMVTGGSGVEAARVTCKTAAKGCPLASTVLPLAAGRTSLSRLLKEFPLEPGARVSVQLSVYGVKLSTLTLIVRDDQQPKVKRR